MVFYKLSIFFLIRSNFFFPFVPCAVGVVCSSAWRVSLLLTSKILRICLWCCVKCDLTWWCKLVVPIFFEEIFFPHWMGLIYFLKDHMAICLLVKRFIYIFNVFICVCVSLCVSHTCNSQWRPEEGIRFPETDIIGGCVWSAMWILRSQTWVLSKGS